MADKDKPHDRAQERRETERRPAAQPHPAEAKPQAQHQQQAQEPAPAPAGTEAMAHPVEQVDQAASPVSANHPADPGAAARPPAANPSQNATALRQTVEQSGGGDAGMHAFIDGACDHLDQMLERGDIDGAREYLGHLRSGKADFARGVARR